LILHQLDARRSCLPHGSPGSPGRLALSFATLSLNSVIAFAGPWSGGGSFNFWTLSPGSDLGGRTRRGDFWKRGDSGWTHIAHHFRFLEIFHAPEMENTRKSSGSQGIRFNRVVGALQLPQGHKLKAFEMVEGRYTVAVTTTLMLQSPVYSMTILFEDQQLEYSLSRFRLELDQKSWQESNLQPGIFCNGIVIFQLALFQIIKRYSDAWTNSLNAIDQMVQVQVRWYRYFQTHRSFD
jgi:hypothetical protein